MSCASSPPPPRKTCWYTCGGQYISVKKCSVRGCQYITSHQGSKFDSFFQHYRLFLSKFLILPNFYCSTGFISLKPELRFYGNNPSPSLRSSHIDQIRCISGRRQLHVYYTLVANNRHHSMLSSPHIIFPPPLPLYHPFPLHNTSHYTVSSHNFI